MKFHIGCLSATVLAFAAASPMAHAQGFQSLDEIDSQVASFIGVDPDVAGSAFHPVDRRLRLAACSSPLALDWYGIRQDSVLVRCPEPAGWKIYVRLKASSTRAVAAQPVIKRGDAVSVMLRGPGFSVSQAGEALDGGAAGEWVRIRIGKSDEMRAQVLRPGLVGMNLP